MKYLLPESVRMQCPACGVPTTTVESVHASPHGYDGTVTAPTARPTAPPTAAPLSAPRSASFAPGDSSRSPPIGYWSCCPGGFTPKMHMRLFCTPAARRRFTASFAGGRPPRWRPPGRRRARPPRAAASYGGSSRPPSGPGGPGRGTRPGSSVDRGGSAGKPRPTPDSGSGLVLVRGGATSRRTLLERPSRIGVSAESGGCGTP